MSLESIESNKIKYINLAEYVKTNGQSSKKSNNTIEFKSFFKLNFYPYFYPYSVPYPYPYKKTDF